tara:strand:- start:180 stop:371 length:192 start_codon:yes stop_codon:yes gene_type:complete
MHQVIDPGQVITIANFIVTLSMGFVFGLPLILIAGSRIQTKRKLLILTPEELAYEATMFGFSE